MFRPLYAFAVEVARFAASVAPERDGKFWRSLGARKGILERYAAWGAAHRDAARPLLWMHAPSVGEGLQARPVIERLRASHDTLQLAYTHFSPSAERFAHSLGADFADYLPFDSAADARAALDALRPDALVYSKLDVWPELTREASQRGVALGLISATLAARSARQSRVVAALLRDAYSRLDAVGAIDQDDAARLLSLGVRETALEVTGDTRYDQVWSRAQGVDRAGPLLTPLASPRPTVVAGSTWPADEAVLMPAWRSVRRQIPNVRLIIAPHEPAPSQLASIEHWAAAERLSLARLNGAHAATADVVLVDRVGVLGELYALAAAAFVGGGFHDAGLHSVIEPAAFGAPVAFGPRCERSRDAMLLAKAGGGVAVPQATALAGALIGWLHSEAARRSAGEQARAVVRNGLGAADRSTRLVETLLERARPDRTVA
ncbi:MAG TPA: glycosyltransferase N-terminal domain-containing protein [Gemmatimonadaceae bacterium]|nr:glycosyltransferase N-terminal domain-containing protein [Gemmatimonadaceae bacterium]